MDFGPILSRVKPTPQSLSVRYTPARIKKDSSDAMTAPPFTACGSDLIFIYDLLIEKVIYTDRTPKVALFIKFDSLAINPPKKVVMKS